MLRQTIRKRLQAKLGEVKIELRRRMHDPIEEVGNGCGQWSGDTSDIMACPRTPLR